MRNNKLQRLAIDKLRTIQQSHGDDPEKAHGDADDVLCELLTSLGYAKVVEEWHKIEKWYA